MHEKLGGIGFGDQTRRHCVLKINFDINVFVE